MKLLARVVIWLYPRSYRQRYGAEIADLLEHSDRPARDALDVFWSALLAYRPRWLLLLLFWAALVSVYLRFPPLYFTTLSLALFVTGLWAGLLVRSTGPWWSHAGPILFFFGLLWFVVGLTPATVVAFLGWMAGGLGLAYLVYRRRPWLAVMGAIGLISVLTLLVAGPQNTLGTLLIGSLNWEVADLQYVFLPLVMLNPALALAMSTARRRGTSERRAA